MFVDSHSYLYDFVHYVHIGNEIATNCKDFSSCAGAGYRHEHTCSLRRSGEQFMEDISTT